MMNLRNLLSWKKPAAEPTGGAAETGAPEPTAEGPTGPTADNVVAFPVRHESHQEPDGAAVPSTSEVRRPQGLLGAPEFREFFEENHFGYGRHNGSHHRTHEALDLGRQERIARFQNIAAGLMASRLTRLSRLKAEALAIEGISPITSAQLHLACEHVGREVEMLREQIELASCGSGWIREALTRYEAGFSRGLREALDFDGLIG